MINAMCKSIHQSIAFLQEIDFTSTFVEKHDETEAISGNTEITLLFLSGLLLSNCYIIKSDIKAQC